MQSPASTATTPTWRRIQSGAVAPHLWQRVLSNLAVSEQALSACSVSHFFHDCSKEYMRRFWSEPILHLPHDTRSLERAMEMCQYLTRQEGYVEGTTVVVELGSGVYEVVGSCKVPGWGTCQQTLSFPCDNLSIVGKGSSETIILGSLVTENGMSSSVKGVTVKNLSGIGLVVFGEGTKMEISRVTIEECTSAGVYVTDGAKLIATGCQFHQNGVSGLSVSGSTTTACLINCTSHHNKSDGVCSSSGAVVDLMREGTSVHDNKGYGLYALSGAINIYQPCVLDDMSYGNKRENISMRYGGTIQQKR